MACESHGELHHVAVVRDASHVHAVDRCARDRTLRRHGDREVPGGAGLAHYASECENSGGQAHLARAAEEDWGVHAGWGWRH